MSKFTILVVLFSVLMSFTSASASVSAETIKVSISCETPDAEMLNITYTTLNNPESPSPSGGQDNGEEFPGGSGSFTLSKSIEGSEEKEVLDTGEFTDFLIGYISPLNLYAIGLDSEESLLFMIYFEDIVSLKDFTPGKSYYQYGLLSRLGYEDPDTGEEESLEILCETIVTTTPFTEEL